MPDSSDIERFQPRLLVVDDDPELCVLVRDILSDYDVDMLEDGSQVSAQLAGKSYQIMICDLHMPGFSGLELMKVIKPHYPELEILMLTGGGSVENAVEAMKLGASEFLLKPVRVAELREAVRRAAKRLEMGHENRLLKDLYNKQKFLDKMREDFVILINHELRTPLTSLKFLETELTAKREQLPEDLRSVVDIFRTSLASLELLADDLLWLGEKRNSPLPLAQEEMDPPRILRDLVDEQERNMSERRVQFKLEGDSSFTWRGDPRRLRQIVAELLSNAVRATRDNGTIRLGAYLNDRDLIIEVVDNGIGIPKKMIPVIFEPFQTLGSMREHHSSENAHLGGGLGVGLSIVRDLVERMGGTIGIVSDEGRGCMVEVRLKESAVDLQPRDETPPRQAQLETEKAKETASSAPSDGTASGSDPLDEIIRL